MHSLRKGRPPMQRTGIRTASHATCQARLQARLRAASSGALRCVACCTPGGRCRRKPRTADACRWSDSAAHPRCSPVKMSQPPGLGRRQRYHPSEAVSGCRPTHIGGTLAEPWRTGRCAGRLPLQPATPLACSETRFAQQHRPTSGTGSFFSKSASPPAMTTHVGGGQQIGPRSIALDQKAIGDLMQAVVDWWANQCRRADFKRASCAS